MFDYETNKKFAPRAHAPHLKPRHIPCNAKAQCFKAESEKYLEIAIYCIHSCYLNWCIKNGGHRADFQAVVPQSSTYLCRKPGSIEKSNHFVCECANHMLLVLFARIILLSKDVQCNTVASP